MKEPEKTINRIVEKQVEMHKEEFYKKNEHEEEAVRDFLWFVMEDSVRQYWERRVKDLLIGRVVETAEKASWYASTRGV